MPQIKKRQPLYGIQYAIEPAVTKYCRRHHLPISPEVFARLVRLAEKPHTAISRWACGELQAFGNLFAHHPDHALGLLQLIRQEIAALDVTANGRVRKFLLSHSVVTFQGKRRAVFDLDAGEIASLLGKSVNPGDVTTERKKLRRQLEQAAIFEQPDVEHYIKTGAWPKTHKRRPTGNG